MWITKILEFFFPVNCLFCAKKGQIICKQCLLELPIFDGFICPVCHQKNIDGRSCLECQNKTELEGVLIASHYINPRIKKIIKRLKYIPFDQSMANILTNLMIKKIEESNWHCQYFKENHFIIIPVPLARRKFAQRGFNQAQLIADKINQKFNWPVKTEILKRIKETKSQTGLNKDQRGINLKKAFGINQKFLQKNPNFLKNKNIILIDDIFTTGATVESAVSTLKEYGANKIWAIMAAKG